MALGRALGYVLRSEEGYIGVVGSTAVQRCRIGDLSPRCGLGRPPAWAALAARLHRSGGPAASASDDAVLTQARDRGGVEAEPVGKHFGGVLAE